MTENDFKTTFARAELDTDLWVVAWDGDEVAGVVQNWIWPEENERLGVKRGWLEHISVRRPWRRRGLARAITAASLRQASASAGSTEAMLGVDSENPNGALGLYEGLGFEVMQPRGGLPARPRAAPAAAAAAVRRRAGRRRGRAPSRPARGRSSSPGRGPGRRRRGPRARAAARSTSTIAAGSPPGRSTRPQPPANSVSPLNSRPSSSAMRQTEPSVWPGVWSTRSRISPNRTTPPSASSTAGHRRRDLERRERAAAGRSAARGRADGRRSRRRCARPPRRCRRCGPSGRGSRR